MRKRDGYVRKEIEINEEILPLLERGAKEDNRSLKNYIEHVLENQSKILNVLFNNKEEQCTSIS